MQNPKPQTVTSYFQKLYINFPKAGKGCFKKLRLAFDFKSNFSINRILDTLKLFLGLLEVRYIESQLYHVYGS